MQTNGTNKGVQQNVKPTCVFTAVRMCVDVYVCVKAALCTYNVSK